MAGFRKSKFAVTFSLNNSDNPEERLCAVFHTLTKSFAVFPEKGWDSLGKDGQLDDATVEALIRQGFLVKEGVDEMVTFWNWRQQIVHNFDTLGSKNLVTRQCNNQCRYCIFDAEAKSMSSETAKKIDSFFLNLIKERNPKRINDLFSGGEIMLNLDVLIESATRRYYFCMGRGLDYGFKVISNGTLLTPEAVMRMKEVGLRGINVSVAGPERIHDNLRPLRNGGKTYDRIMRNLKAISGIVPIAIETQYDSASNDYLEVPEMMDDIKARGIEVERISFTAIAPRRGEAEFKAGMGDPEVYLYLLKEAERRGFEQFKAVPMNACLTDYRDRIVFDTDGSIIPCGSLQSGEMVIGNVATGIDFVAESQVLERKFPDRCTRECEILPICMGGCRLQSLAKNGDFSSVDCLYDAIRLSLDEYLRRRSAQTLAGKGIKVEGIPGN